MKRLLSLILCLVMLFSLVACGSSASTDAENETADAQITGEEKGVVEGDDGGDDYSWQDYCFEAYEYLSRDLDFAQAIETFHDALELEPNGADCYQGLGEAYMRCAYSVLSDAISAMQEDDSAGIPDWSDITTSDGSCTLEELFIKAYDNLNKAEELFESGEAAVMDEEPRRIIEDLDTCFSVLSDYFNYAANNISLASVGAGVKETEAETEESDPYGFQSIIEGMTDDTAYRTGTWYICFSKSYEMTVSDGSVYPFEASNEFFYKDGVLYIHDYVLETGKGSCRYNNSYDADIEHCDFYGMTLEEVATIFDAYGWKISDLSNSWPYYYVPE